MLNYNNPYFEDYDSRFPDIVLEILEYFDLGNKTFNINNKSVLDFCMNYGTKKGWGNECSYEPIIVHRICMKLYEFGVMQYIPRGVFHSDLFISIFGDRNSFYTYRNYLREHYNSIVYGFPYIYNLYKEKVLPMPVKLKKDNSPSIGTCVKYWSGILTAKHCFEDSAKMSIRGYSADFLKSKPVYISDNPNIDIAFIATDEPHDKPVLSSDGKVIDEVLVMGYPRVPGFSNFLTVEKASVSSISIPSIIPTMGSVAAVEPQLLSGLKVMLITAKIKGGNSGGPVISRTGSIIGIACEIPKGEGNYDDMGYGIALPISLANDIVDLHPERLPIPDDFYEEYEGD